MVESGLLQGEKLELLRGELVEMSPIGGRYVWTVTRLNRLLCKALDERGTAQLQVHVQQPLIAADESEPITSGFATAVVPIVPARAPPADDGHELELAFDDL